MTANEHFTKAPITEALIDLRVTLPAGATADVFNRLASVLGQGYPEKQNLISGQIQVSLSEQPQVQTSQEIPGVRLISADNHYVIQAHLGGLTFSVLAPYDRWETFRDEARRVWNTYREMFAKLTVTRVAVRYINRIDIPEPGIDVRNYLRTFPEISSDVPQMLAGYFMQLLVPLSDLESMLIINQTNIPPSHPETISIILDLDLYRDKNVPQEEEELWQFFEQLRIMKNDVFVSCITERTKRLLR